MHQPKNCALLMLLMLANVLLAQRTYIVKRSTTAISIDGKLDETDWTQAAATDTFRYVDSGIKSKTSTVVKAVWDDNYLYVAFIAQDTSIWADITKNDGELWTRDVAEVFIDTNGDSTNYAEIGVGPNNVYYDYILPTRPEFNNWKINTKWTLKGFIFKVSSVASISNKKADPGWILEMAIPFNHIPAPSTIHKPKANEVWRVNFCRIDFDINNTSSVRYYAWNPTGAIAFHRPFKFGKLIFASVPVQ